MFGGLLSPQRLPEHVETTSRTVDDSEWEHAQVRSDAGCKNLLESRKEAAIVGRGRLFLIECEWAWSWRVR